MSNCYTICKEVTIVLIVVKTSTIVTKVQLMSEITDFNYQPFKTIVLRLKTLKKKKRKSKKMTKKRRDRKKIQIFEFRNCIRIFGTNTNIRISVDILTLFTFINAFYSWFTSPIPHITHLPQTLLPTSPPPHQLLINNIFFLNLHKNVTSPFTSTLTLPPKPDTPPPIFFFNFRPLTPLPPNNFFLIFTRASLLRSHPP